MKKLTPKNLALLGFLVYFASYMTRKSYNGIIKGIISGYGIEKDLATLPASLALISYGLGQLISGFIGDRIKPQWIIFVGLLSSSIINLLMAAELGVTAMCILWALNGFAQSLIWPPLVRILASNMSQEEYKKACVTVNAAGSLATVFIYIISAVFIEYASWKFMFILAPVVGIIVGVLFLALTSNRISADAPLQKIKSDSSDTPPRSNIKLTAIIISSGLLFICLAILFQGTLRDGIETLMPVILNENFGASDSLSTFLSVTLPLFSIVALKLTSLINEKLIKNEMVLSVVLFAISVMCTGLASVIKILPVGVFLMALATGCMHGINLMLVCQIPGMFAKYGKASTISGAMNFFTYLGGAIFTFGIAVIATKTGWSIVLGICSIVAILGILMCLIAHKKWKKFSEEN